jgi:hypothetical protein
LRFPFRIPRLLENFLIHFFNQQILAGKVAVQKAVRDAEVAREFVAKARERTRRNPE